MEFNYKIHISKYGLLGGLFRLISPILFCFTSLVFSQTPSQRSAISQKYNLSKLERLEKKARKKSAIQRKEAYLAAKKNGWKITDTLEDGSFIELQRLSKNGQPIYYQSYNAAAAKSTRANHLHTGGALGLNLDGQNMTAYVWDSGHARASHQEYDGPGGNNRVSVEDAISRSDIRLSNHAAHVTGTIVAAGVQPEAKGMAPQAKLKGYNWTNDLGEAVSAAADGMLLSNHSYGFRASLLPDKDFGAYTEVSKSWDEVLYNAPYYLMVAAAGNDGNLDAVNAEPLDGNSLYDKLSGFATSKNTLVVANAQDAIVDSNGQLRSVIINSSSSEGPTDDYRIKPDITGNGTAVYSTFSGGNTAYNTITGTSMAAPNVTGSLLLLQQHYNNLNNTFMKAATLKGLALHTADDAGFLGPDAIFGWGLLNTKSAAKAIDQAGNETEIQELSLSNGQRYTISVDADGSVPLLASISWTDPAGAVSQGSNSKIPALVNDLDIRVTKNGRTFKPYKLVGVDNIALEDNSVDPFERVDVTNASGTYQITVTHKGRLQGGFQNFSLIVTGIAGAPIVCNATIPSAIEPIQLNATNATIKWQKVAAATYDLRYRKTGTSLWKAKNNIVSNTVVLDQLTPFTTYELQLRSSCPDNSTSDYSSMIQFKTAEVQLNYCEVSENSAASEYISRVQLADLDNPSSASTSGYGDFTSLSTQLTQGKSYDIRIVPKWSGRPYNEGYGVWIDFNKDGDFFDDGEQVVKRSPTQAVSISESIKIPATATLGNTRMRVILKYNGVPTACDSFRYGEVEDYTVQITQNTPDTVPPSAPTNLVAKSTTQTKTELYWSPATDNIGILEYDIFQDEKFIGSTVKTDYIARNLNPSTTYIFSVRARDAADNLSPFSNPVTVTTQEEGNSGCVSGISNFPYTEGFENSFGKWVQDTSDAIDWTRNTNGTPSNQTGPTSATEGRYYAYVEASGSGRPNKQAILRSPCFDLSAVSQATFSFAYHMYGSSDMGTFAVELSSDEGKTWTSIWSKTGNQGNSWQEVAIDLSDFSEQGIQLRFNRVTGGSFRADVAIDQLMLDTASSSFAALSAESSKKPILVAPKSELKLYPAPVNQGQLYVELPGKYKTNEPHQFAIYNTIGQKIGTGDFDTAIDVSGFTRGIYLLQIDDLEIQRFVIE